MIENIRKNAEMTVQQLRPLSWKGFGYNQESVEWLEAYIERIRKAGKLETEASREKLASVFGSFLGECVIRCYGGSWTQRDGVWCVVFNADNAAFPFAKVAKQIEHGLEDGIGSFFRAIPVVFTAYVQSPAKTRKPWWRFW